MEKRHKGRNVIVMIRMKKNNFKMERLFYGTKTEILIQEKIMLYWYFFEHGQLPPGNKRFQ